jgi:hypothetical protein
MAPLVFRVIGVLVAIAGLVDLIWNQVDFPFPDEFVNGAQRWQVATGPMFVIGIGVLICVAAEILDVLKQRAVHRPRTPAEVEELWEAWSRPDDSSA